MKKLWKKQLPAFLLTLALLVGMAPAALAVGTADPATCAHGTTAILPGATTHMTKCSLCDTVLTSEAHNFSITSRTTEPTCTTKGVLSKECSVCHFIATEEIASLPHTTGIWEQNPAQHWHTCGVCANRVDAANHSWTESILQTATCVSKGLKSVSCTACGYNTTAEIPLTSHSDANRDNLCDVCGTVLATALTVNFYTGGSAIPSQSVMSGGRPTNPGVPVRSGGYGSYVFVGWTTAPTSTYVYTGQGDVKTSDVVAATPITGNTNYYAVYTMQTTGQNISLTLSNTNPITGSSSLADGSTLTSQLYNKFSSLTGGALAYVRFGNAGSGGGTLYANSATAFSPTYTFYYNNPAYGQFSLGALYFQPNGQGSFSIPYSAFDAQGNSVSGTLTLSSGYSTSKISYSVSAGQAVAFNAADFLNAYRSVYPGGTVSYVTFTSASALDSSNGMVYYNYGGSSSVAFDRNSLQSYAFYYSTSNGQYPLSGLSFYGGSNSSARTVTLGFRAVAANSSYVDGTVEIKVSAASQNKISYSVNPGSAIYFNVSHFNNAYRSVYTNGTVSYVTFATSSTMDSSNGGLYYNYGGRNEVAFSRSNVGNYKFYYNNSAYGNYPLDELCFYGGTNTTSRTVTLSYRAFGTTGGYVDGTVEVKINGGSNKITYKVTPGQSVAFQIEDFNKVYQEGSSTGNTVRYVTFSTNTNFNTSVGAVYYNYGGRYETAFSRYDIEQYSFYYNSSGYGNYPLSELSFVAGSDFTSEISLNFRAYYSSSSYVDGTLVIQPGSAAASGDIIYAATYNSNLQLNPNDFARMLNKKYPYETLQYVKLTNVPTTGSLYYDYYGTSQYGTSKLRLTSANCSDVTLYFSPSGSKQYALSDLTYVPSGSNYCATIPFTAYSSSGRSISGAVLISVTLSVVPEVYGVTPKNTAISLPDSNLYSAVAGATGVGLASIQLVSLPDSTIGTLYCGNEAANTTTRYGYTGGSQRINQLRFVPKTGYVGSMELPYVAYNSSGTAIASGKFALGVVNTVKKFSDTPSSAWCFKYVTELSDAKIISGYPDGKFRFNDNITYGAALKLIMLSAGYKEQAPTSSKANVFSGYLAKAKADGLVSGNVDLTKPITRLALAQIAAKAMRLDTSGLSSVKPFTDTSDPYVQALNAAGIVEGYFSGGTSTFKPGNYLTRGHVSAIVWRMDRMRG